MKKNGFIAMSLVYTFFLVFIVVILSILNFYLDNNAVMKNINKEIIDRYNSNYDGQTMTSLASNSVIKKGDFIDYQTNDDNYSAGKWQILKWDATNVYIISNFIVSNIPASQYTVAGISSMYGLTFLNNVIADGIFPLTTADLWQGYSGYELNISSDVTKMWNIGNNYFVINSTTGNTHTIVPNCKCGINNYYTSYLTYTNINDWYSAVCPKGTSINQNQNIIDNCNAKYNYTSTTTSHSSGVRIVIRLKNNTILVGGKGSYNNPYRVGGVI